MKKPKGNAEQQEAPTAQGKVKINERDRCVTESMRLYREESFGPVVGIIRVQDVGAAIRVANDSGYGLSSAVFGADTTRAATGGRSHRSRHCHLNGPAVQDEPQMPFGGVKNSGFGRFGGTEAVREFTDLQWLNVQTVPRHYPI